MKKWSVVFLLLLLVGGAGAQVVVLEEDFEGCTPPAFPDGWVVENANGDPYYFTTDDDPSFNHTPGGSKFAHYAGNLSQLANDWFFTEYLSLTPGYHYRLIYWYRVNPSDYPQNFGSYLLDGQSHSAIYTTLVTHFSVNNTEYAVDSIVFEAPDYDQYCIGFKCFSGPNTGVLYIDDIRVELIIESDVKADSLRILSPPLWSNDANILRGCITNLTGNATDSFFVFLRADEENVDSIKTALSGYESRFIDFTWTPSSDGPHNLAMICGLENDQIPDNDSVTMTCFVYRGPWVESFSDESFPPVGWLVRNYDGYAEWHRMGVLYVDSTGAACFIPQQFDEPRGDWLITPKLGIGGSDTLSLWYRAINPTEFGETLYVMISENTRDTADFVVLDSIITDTTSYFEEWHQKRISLEQYEGKTVYIGFVYSGQWISFVKPRGIVIDVVEGPQPLRWDIGVVSIDVDSVVSVGDTVEVMSTFTNLGVKTVYNLRVGFVIFYGEYSNTFSVDSLPNDDTVQVLFPGYWTPDRVSCYEVLTYNMRHDQDFSNDSLYEDRYVCPPNLLWYEFLEGPSLPYGWQISDVIGTSGDWEIVGTGGGTPYQSPMCGNGQARFNSSEADSGDCTRLITYLANLPDDSLCPYLSFWMYHDNSYPDNHDSLYVEISEDYGDNFVELAGFERYSDVNGWSYHEIPLAKYKGEFVLFSFKGKANGGNDIFIDQITLCEKEYEVQKGDVVINEFVTRGPSNWVELKNLRDYAVSITGCRLMDSAGNEDTLSGFIQSDGYQVWNLQNVYLNPDGDVFYLLSARGDTIDIVGYGYRGGAPAVPAGYSVSRTPDGHDTDDDARDFNISFNPTPGSANNAASTALGSSLVINEVDLIPEFPQVSQMIEIYNPTQHPMVIDTSESAFRFYLSDGDSMALICINDTIEPGAVRCLYAGVDFSLSLNDDDVFYLFDKNLQRIDQIGFYGEEEDYSFQRYPDGAGPNDGYDFLSSGGNVTLFDMPLSQCQLNMALSTVYETGFEDPASQDTGYSYNAGGGIDTHSWVRSHGFLYWGNSPSEPIDTIFPSSGDSFLVCAMDSLGYSNNEYSWWYSLPESGFNLSNYRSGKLTFDIWYSLEYAHDSVYVLITDKSIYLTDFYVLKAYTGNSSGWIHEEIDISPWCGKDPVTGDPHDDIQIAFLLISDDSIAGPDGAGFGAALDNISILAGGNYLAPPFNFRAESYHDGYISLHWETPGLLANYSFEKYTHRERKYSLIASRTVADRGVLKAEGQPSRGVPQERSSTSINLARNTIPEKLNISLTNAGRQVNYYYIYRRQIGEKYFTLIDSTTATSYDDYGVQNRTWYEYYVAVVYDIPPYIGLPSERKWARAGLPNEVLLLGDYAGSPEDSSYWNRFRFALSQGYVTWDEWNVEYLSRYPDSIDLFQYETIIWFSAGPGFEDITVAPARMDMWLLNKPGHLMLINRDFAKDLETEAPPGVDFWTRFKTAFGGDNCDYSSFLTGVDGDSVSFYWATRRLNGNFGFNDFALASGEADPVLLLGEGANHNDLAATKYHSDDYGYKTFWAGFDIIDIGDINEVTWLIGNVIDWFEGVLEPIYTRGDANIDGSRDVSDVSFMLNRIPYPELLPCARAADFNADNSIDITDAVFALYYLLPSPSLPPPDSCGYLPTDTLPCDSFPPCGWYSVEQKTLSYAESSKNSSVAIIRPGPAVEIGENSFEVPLIVESAQPFTAFQVTIRIEDGNGCEVTDRGTVSEDFDFFNSVRDGNRVMIIGLKGLEAGEDGKAKSYLQAGDYEIARITVSNPAGIRLVDGILTDIYGYSISPALVVNIAETGRIPGSFYLSQNVPNPFTDGTIIRYALPTSKWVELSIYDAAGRKVRTLVNGLQTAGYKAVKWDGKDDAGRRVAPGTYFCRLQAGKFKSVRKIELIR